MMLHDYAMELKEVSRSFGENDVVNNVSFSLSEGEVLTLIGPSGCGKSTLLRLIAGLEKPDNGTVILAGRDVSSVKAENRNVGFVFQDNALFGHLRVADNIAFGLRHLPKQQRNERINEMLSLTQLDGMGRRYPHELSGGEQQRVALARALASQPSVVLLDEPFASLDGVLREELGHQVTEILRSARTTSILVTHDRREAMSLGDRLAVMNAGTLEQCDLPRVVYSAPATRFVASFLDEASFLKSPDGSFVVARPHQWSIRPAGPDVITRVEFVGAVCRYTVSRNDGTTVAVDHDFDTALSRGNACTVALKTDALHRLPS
jgi:iron(III) transport system ATP-binding protein